MHQTFSGDPEVSVGLEPLSPQDIPALSPTRRHLRGWVVVLRKPPTIAGVIVLLGLLFVAALGPTVVKTDPLGTNIASPLAPPSKQFPLGTDGLGRDLLARIIHGSRQTLLGTLAASLIGSVIGTAGGLVAGFFGGTTDYLLMAGVDLLLSFPNFLLIVVIVAILSPSLTSAIIAVGIWMSPFFARIVRANTLELKDRPFVEAARVTGESESSILFRYILPNCMSTIIVLFTNYLGQSILELAALGFLGLGAQPPAPEWGTMTAIGREYIFEAPAVLAVPAAFIMVTALAFNFLGDAIRDALDPRARED